MTRQVTQDAHIAPRETFSSHFHDSCALGSPNFEQEQPFFRQQLRRHGQQAPDVIQPIRAPVERRPGFVARHWQAL